jgi:hypothetical protein
MGSPHILPLLIRMTDRAVAVPWFLSWLRRGGVDDAPGWCLRDIAEGPPGGLDSAGSRRRSGMKYVPSWEPRSSATEEVQARSLQVFSKWSPTEGTRFLQFVGRVDGTGGFAVVETDEPALIARDAAIFDAFFDETVYPVVDIDEAARIIGEAIEFRRSV